MNIPSSIADGFDFFLANSPGVGASIGILTAIAVSWILYSTWSRPDSRWLGFIRPWARRRITLLLLTGSCLASVLGCMKLLHQPAETSHQESVPPQSPSSNPIAARSAESPNPPNLSPLFPNVTLRPESEHRHAMDAYPYQEQQWQGSTHVLGTIRNEVAWTRAKSPYVVDENVFVAKDGLLRIEPGTTVKFLLISDSINPQKDLIALHVAGQMLAEGTPRHMIRFLSTDPGPVRCNKWNGIQLLPSVRPSIVKWCSIESAGFGIEASGSHLIAHNIFTHCHTGIWLDQGFSGRVSHNVIAWSAYNGILCHTTGPEALITGNIFYELGRGIEGLWDAAPYADYNLFGSADPARQPDRRGKVEPSPHDIVADPLFIDPAHGNWALKKNSPARDATADGCEIGLDAAHWSRRRAARENENWLAGKSREQWIEGLMQERGGNLGLARQTYESALRDNRALGKQSPELRDLTFLSLGRVLTAQGNPAQAETLLRGALEKSGNPHLRDQFRRALADSLAAEGKSRDALAVLDKIEWPQSRVWVEAARAKCAVLTGDPAQALATLAAVREKEPYRYVTALAKMVEDALKANQPESAAALCKGFDAYPLAEQGSTARLQVARALETQGNLEAAARLLRVNIEQNPYGRQAPQALTLLAWIEDQLGQSAQAAKTRARLCTDYYLFDPLVAEAPAKINFKPLSPKKLVLLDASQGESSIYDRDIQGSCNFGQYEVLATLVNQGYKVHENSRDRDLAQEKLKYYGLVVMHGRYGATDDPPLPPQVIDNLVAYVNGGGSLLVIGAGSHLGRGRMAQFYNPLLGRFGIKFRENSDIPWDRNVCEATSHPAVQGLTRFVALGGVQVDAKQAEVLGTFNREPMLVLRQYGKGRVVAAGLGSGLLGNCMSVQRGTDRDVAQQNGALLRQLAATLLAAAPAEAPPFQDQLLKQADQSTPPAGPAPKKTKAVPETRTTQKTPATPKLSGVRILVDEVGITGNVEGVERLNPGQQRQLLAWLGKAKDPVAQYCRLGNDRALFTGLYDIFRDLKAEAAKLYLAQSFLNLAVSPENWPPAEANFTWIETAFTEADRANPAANAVVGLRKLVGNYAKKNVRDARTLAVCSRLESGLSTFSALSPLFEPALKAAQSDADRVQIISWKARCLEIGGKIRNDQSQLREVAALYEQALSIKPVTDTAWSLIGVWARLGDKHKLDQLLSKALAWFPQEDYVTHSAAGEAYLKMGAYKEAEKQFRQTLDTLVPGYEFWNSGVRFNLAEVYLKQGRRDQARAMAREAMAWYIFASHAQHSPEAETKYRFDQKMNELKHTLAGLDLSDMTFEAIDKEIDSRRMNETLKAIKQRYQKMHPAPPAQPVANRREDGPPQPSVTPASPAGKPISEQEASQIIEKLISRIYLPAREFQALKLEFKPRYLDLTDYLRQRKWDPSSQFLNGVRYGTFEGLDATWLFRNTWFYDEALARADKAVFYWKRPETEDPKQLNRNLAMIQLYNKKGKALKVHPFVGAVLGRACAERLWLNRPPLAMPREPGKAKPGDPSIWEKKWFLNIGKTSATLTLQFRNAAFRTGQSFNRPWQFKEVRYAPDEMLPLAVSEKMWNSRQGVWMAFETSCEFSRLGESGRVTVSRMGVNIVKRYEWANVKNAWVVHQVSGSSPPLADPRMKTSSDPSMKTPWTMEFTGIEINPEIPDKLLAWPERKPVKLDFASPDAAAKTVLDCIRNDRADLLPWCNTRPPRNPPPTKAPVSELSYCFGVFKKVKEMKITDKKQAGEGWVYRVEIYDPLGMRTRSADLKIVPQGQEWRVKRESPPLLLSLIHD